MKRWNISPEEQGLDEESTVDGPQSTDVRCYISFLSIAQASAYEVRFSDFTLHGRGLSTVDRGLNRLHNTERKHQNRTHQFEHQSDGEANNPEREKDQPDEREQEQRR